MKISHKKNKKWKINVKEKTKWTKRKREKQREKKKVTLPMQPIFPNDFSHVVYLVLHQNLKSVDHSRYVNDVIC